MAWLIPNHYYPWATFHTDAWVGIMLAIMVVAIIFCTQSAVEWHGLAIVVASLAVVPFLQFFAGMLSYSGQAWVFTTYMLGLLLAMLMGARWEAASPGRAADGLFVAIGIASIVSVGLQLLQWLGLTLPGDELQIWAAEFSPGRPSANLAQPNQLATLLLWGLCSVFWAWTRKKISASCAIFMALYILFGIALTQSRIALISIFAIVVSTWFWRRLWVSRWVPWTITLLSFYFFIFSIFLQNISNFLHLNLQIRSASLGGPSTQLRLKAYGLFLDAVGKNPWFGYGEYQLPKAQLAVAQDHPNLTAFFTHSHNLFLDFFLWWGVPIGFLFSMFLIVWMVRCLGGIKDSKDFLLALFLLVVGLHAMVEFPLHHAYFLLPTGFVVGMLNKRLNNKVIFKTNRWFVFAIWVAVGVLLSIIVRDYLKIDNNFRAYRLETSPLRQPVTQRVPEVFLLNDFYAFLDNARSEVSPNIDDVAFQKLRMVTYAFPSPVNLFNFTKALVYRGEYAEARRWMEKIQKVQPDGYYEDFGKIWEAQSREQPALAAVTWMPIEGGAGK